MTHQHVVQFGLAENGLNENDFQVVYVKYT